MAQLGVELEEPFQFQEEMEEGDDVLKTQAEKAARTLSERVRKLVEDAVLPLFATGILVVDTQEIIDKVSLASDGPVRLEAYAVIRPAWGMGRNEAGQVFQDFVREGYYSAILDSHVCDVCAEEDGRILRPGELATPNPRCLGGVSQCRCISVWILKDEVRPDEVSARWESAFGI